MPGVTTAHREAFDVSQLLQFLGAAAILGAFALNQLGSLRSEATAYHWLNLFGSALLAVLAGFAAQWGFLFLEGCWALISAWGLARPRRPAAS